MFAALWKLDPGACKVQFCQRTEEPGNNLHKACVCPLWLFDKSEWILSSAHVVSKNTVVNCLLDWDQPFLIIIGPGGGFMCVFSSILYFWFLCWQFETSQQNYRSRDIVWDLGSGVTCSDRLSTWKCVSTDLRLTACCREWSSLKNLPVQLKSALTVKVSFNCTQSATCN